MGVDKITKIASPPTKVASSSNQFNEVVDSLSGRLVHRDTDGNVTDGGHDIGGPGESGRYDNIHLKEGMTIDGQAIDFSDLELETTHIASAKATSSGFPDFLEAGGGSNRYFNILGDATDLDTYINGIAYTLELDRQSDTLGLPTADSVYVNDSELTDQEYTKVIGEYGYGINIESTGAGAIYDLDGTVQCFKLTTAAASEVFIAKIDMTNNRLVPLLRGIGGTDRIVFADGDVITLLKAHYIFLDNDMSTIETTTNYPKWCHEAPTSPTPVEKDYYKNISDGKWYRYSGASWEALGRIYLGYAICDDTGCKWVEHTLISYKWKKGIDVLADVDIANASFELFPNMEINVKETQVTMKSIQSIGWDNLDTGAEAASTWYYLYLSDAGEFILSTKIPRRYDERSGAYHPSEYWKCIDIFYNNASSHFNSLLREQRLLGVQLNQAYFLKKPPLIANVMVGGIVAWHKDFGDATVPDLPDEFMECNGQEIKDEYSPMNGKILPDLNGDGRFLRGSATSGTSQSSQNDAHTHTNTAHNHISNSHTHTQLAHGHNIKSYATGGASHLVTASNGAGTLTNTPADSTTAVNNTATNINQTASVSIDSQGGAEARPINMTVVWTMRIK